MWYAKTEARHANSNASTVFHVRVPGQMKHPHLCLVDTFEGSKVMKQEDGRKTTAL